MSELESSAGYPDSPMEQDDVPYVCKGCGEMLEEGKAFELAGNRWHIDCFRCNTCGTLLDSDAHLLLLGDGSLICNNCTYSCSSCGNKIEDLAFLTGDQAFCSNCFKCRNCKRKIENLRYARTSQGIFCMDCHDALMQRRRKRRAAPQAKKPAPAGIKLDKSLPSLPPEEPEDRAPESSAEVPTHNRAVQDSGRVEDSSARQPANQDNFILPSSTYRSSRQSILSHKSEADPGGGGSEEFLIPVAFDPAAEGRSTRSGGASSKANDRHEHPQEPLSHETPAENPSPHIAYQEKGREPADIDPSRWRQDGSSNARAAALPERSRQQNVSSPRGSRNDNDSRDGFKLQDAPRGRRSGSERRSRIDLMNFREGTPTSPPNSTSPAKSQDKDASKAASPASQRPVQDTTSAPSRPSNDLHKPHENGTPFTTPAATMQYPPKRGDSLESKLHHLYRKDVGSPPMKPISDHSDAASERSASVSSAPQDITSPQQRPASSKASTKTAGDFAVGFPSRSDSQQRTRTESVSTLQSEPQRMDLSASPILGLRYSAGIDFSMDEDLARILGTDVGTQNADSFLRRVSNSVRHGRSFSDKGSRLSKDTKWPKSPINGTMAGQDVGSPGAGSPENRDEITWLRNELRRERQRVIEKEQRIAELEAALSATADATQLNSELREKRSTMVVLDAQKEIVLRELSVLTDHLKAEKDSKAPLDVAKLTNNVLREFAESIQQLKDSFAPQIEELMQKRSDVAEELANLSRMKDKSFQEFEQLSSKNAQLAELNNQLVHQIQELYKANSNEASRPTNGLGIYHNKEKSMTALEALRLGELAGSVSAPNIQEEAEAAAVVPGGPQVVSIRKGQPRKFNWKKGGQNVAKGVTKGLKGAFSSSEPKEAVPYNATAPAQEPATGMPRSHTQDPSRQPFGFFGNQKNRQAATKTQQNGTSQPSAEVAPAGLFGTDLEQRLEHEKTIIPNIVSRCIQEVELRGMDMEGIYRKSGASSAIQTIREGFERSPLDYDLSDPDLDIHAVTSALKQYFRKLPTPLITYDVYDRLLDTNDITSHSARVEALQDCLKDLPRVHRDVLEFLMFHLKRVVEHEKENLMTSMNIAVVFAPTIMRPESLAREMTDVQKKNEALKFLVENCQEVFMGMQ
ncbi:hypothetical protein VTN02DRAFT_500 [Thermoascus thermophilus]